MDAAQVTGSASFLLTHPLWDVTKRDRSQTGIQTFLLTHPLWDVTPTPADILECASISTHTSLVGCDTGVRHVVPLGRHFYSHIPCGM